MVMQFPPIRWGKKALALSLEAKRILPEHPVTFVTRGQKHWAVILFFHSKGGDKGSGSESSAARLRAAVPPEKGRLRGLDS